MLNKLKPLFINGSKRNLTATTLMLVFISVVSVMLIGFVSTRELLIEDEGIVKRIATQRTYVGEVLKDEQIVLGEYDELNCETDTKVSEIKELKIDRAVLAYVNFDGQRKEVYTAKNTVAETLKKENITLGEYDEITPVLEAEVQEGTEISISRVTVDYLENEIIVPYQSKITSNPEQYSSYERVVQKGQNGTLKQTIKIVMRDGTQVSEAVVSEETVSEPVTHIVEKGTKEKPKLVTNTGISSKKENSSGEFVLGQKRKNADFSYSRSITCNATAYDASVESNGIYAGKTASGMKMQYGVVAVDPRVIPLGTKLYIESSDGGKSWVYGYAIAGDTGGAIKGNKIDLFFWSRSEVYNFGRRTATVYVLD